MKRVVEADGVRVAEARAAKDAEDRLVHLDLPRAAGDAAGGQQGRLGVGEVGSVDGHAQGAQVGAPCTDGRPAVHGAPHEFLADGPGQTVQTREVPVEGARVRRTPRGTRPVTRRKERHLGARGSGSHR